MRNLFVAFLVAVLPFWAFAVDIVVPAVVLKPSSYHRWAHYSWVWNHNAYSNQDAVQELIKGYKDNNIPFGGVNIDSTWATQFNNFEVDPNKFSDFPALIKSIHDQGLRVILWATSMINVENPDYQMCIDNNYLVRDARGKSFPLHWWHGDGGLLDYTNPEALKWWHSKMDQVLDVGVDGFKCDGTDPYIDEYILTGGAYGYNNQTITYREYADSYYGDFFDYTRQKRGEAGLIMSRPVDCLLDQATKFCTSFSPKRVMYSGWVGDDDSTFNGMRGCARKMIFSAWNGYASYGCDIGGYRGGGNEMNKQLFLRWAQLGAFSPLMENGGGGEHRPWMYDEETTDVYRKLATEHHRLAPYVMTSTVNAINEGTSTIKPLAERPDIPLYRVKQPTTFNYLLGPDVLVHPALADMPTNSTDMTLVEALFPAGSDWLDWWVPHDTKRVRKGDTRAILPVPLSSVSVYVRKGAMLPLERSTEDHSVMFTWFGPSEGQTIQSDSLESVEVGTGIQGTGSFSEGVLSATISAHAGSAGLVFVGINEPASVDVASSKLAGCVNRYEKLKSTLTVFCTNVDAGVKVTASGVTSIF